MTPSAHVRSVQTLQDLKDVLNRFAIEAQGSVRSAEGEIRLVEEWLRERQAHWRVEVQRRQEELRLAEAALARCRASASRDSRTGARHAPSCKAEQAAVQQARSRLGEAQAELSNVENWTRTVGQAAASYRGQAQRLSQKLSSDLPKGHAFLQRKISELQGYLKAASAPSASSGHSTSSPQAGNARPAPVTGARANAPVQSISVDQIDLSDSPITGTGDFHKASAQEMVEGFHKLQDVVAPAVAGGADGDYFSQLDAAQGLDYSNGYRCVYDAFYGDGAIILEKVGNSFQVLNGYHRLFVAGQLGVKSVPAKVVGYHP